MDHKTHDSNKRLIFVLGLLGIVAIIGTYLLISIITESDVSQASFTNNSIEYPKEQEVVAINSLGNEELLGLNVRKEPCSEEIIGTVDFGETGTVLEDPQTETCLGQSFTWYHITWNDGTQGWSISDFLEEKNK